MFEGKEGSHMMKMILLVALTIILIGCATGPSKQEQAMMMNVGMSKPEVLALMGTPESRGVVNGVELFRYKWSPSKWSQPATSINVSQTQTQGYQPIQNLLAASFQAGVDVFQKMGAVSRSKPKPIDWNHYIVKLIDGRVTEFGLEKDLK